MATSINPGYDFTVNEVPTHAKVLQTATGLSIGGLTLDNVAATLIGQLSGNTSGNTGASLPQEAWMWAAPDGTILIETFYTESDITEAVVTPLWRPGGGWASTRFRYVEGAGVADYAQGVQARISDNLAVPNAPEDVRIYHVGYDNAVEASLLGVFSATPSSTYSGSHRLSFVGRGITPLWEGGGALSQTPPYYEAWRATLVGIGRFAINQAYGAAAGERVWFASLVGAAPGSSDAGANWNGIYNGYVYSSGIWGP